MNFIEDHLIYTAWDKFMARGGASLGGMFAGGSLDVEHLDLEDSNYRQLVMVGGAILQRTWVSTACSRR
jgi:hypothetical protein